jgi:hypothetical protein
VWSTDKERQRLPVTGDAERPLPNARHNVTSKTPKQKIMQLIAGRFRERRQMLALSKQS